MSNFNFKSVVEAEKEAEYLLKVAEECFTNGAIVDSPALIEHGKKFERKAKEIYEAIKLGRIK
jgi:hypothetical protein